jgi:Outer membrane receptor for ferrienterochelin and colicins
MIARGGARTLACALALWSLPAPVRPPHSTAQENTSRRAAARDTIPVIQTDDPPPLDELVEFHRHARSNPLGYFVDEEQMATLHADYASEALRRVPGVVVRPSGRIGNQVRIRGCAPLVWVDRQRVPGAELDDVAHAGDVAAMEVYRSLSGVPAEFTDRTAVCGTIIVWLKVG